MIHIDNVRLNHATNSSSSHSLIFTKGDDIGGANSWGHEYGWEDFTLSRRADKLDYFAVAVGVALTEALPRDYAELAMKELGLSLKPVDNGGYIDHQSAWAMPRTFGSDAPDLEFIRELKAFVERDDIAILGGNDNSDGHPLTNQYNGFRFPFTDTVGQAIVRKDGDYWTLFTPDTGAKIRFSFNDPRKKPAPDPRTPELVDIKLTDRCPFCCSFCYQGSLPSGKEKRKIGVWQIIDALEACKVFEVALGGGEPTMMPDFVDVLSRFRRAGIVPNFTTRSLSWLRDPELCPKVMKNCGAFAYSAHTQDEIKKYSTLIDSLGISKGCAHVQVVLGPGLVDKEYKLEGMLAAAKDGRHNITLLGFKETPAALQHLSIRDQEEWAKRKPGWWISTVKEHGWRVGVDTLLAAEIDGEFPSQLYKTREGISSCYIDAVEGKMGRSSYEPAASMVDFPDGYGDELVTRFKAKFHEVRGSA